MPRAEPPLAAADKEPGRVDRGQRVARETDLAQAWDGKERAHFARPLKAGALPPDMTGAGERVAAPITVEDVVEVPEAASSWEALEDDEAD
jgi:hypothetical protein